jgi:hypothetical protein
MRRKMLLVAALLTVVGAFVAAPRSAKAALTCPEHPPGFCCSGPPLCRCTRGSCI